MINLIHVRTFLTVLDELGFRPAARRLDLSPSTIVEHVRQLEADLRAPLIVRHRGRVEPTAQGALFQPLAKALIDTAQRAHELVTLAPLRVAASSNIGTYLLQPQLASFQSSHLIRVEPWFGTNPAVAERLMRGLADVALMEWWEARPGFETTAWRREALVVIVAPDHPWATRRSISAAELAGARILGGETGSGTGTVLRKALGATADRLNVVGGYGSTEAVKRAVRSGQGISIVFAAAVTEDVAQGALVALRFEDIEVEKELCVVVARGLPQSSGSARFVSYLLGTRS